MIAGPEDRLRVALAKLASHEQEAVLDFAEFLAQRRAETMTPMERVSEEDHTRIIAALDAAAALSQEAEPLVSNRDHDDYLYGKR